MIHVPLLPRRLAGVASLSYLALPGERPGIFARLEGRILRAGAAMNQKN